MESNIAFRTQGVIAQQHSWQGTPAPTKEPDIEHQLETSFNEREKKITLSKSGEGKVTYLIATLSNLNISPFQYLTKKHKLAPAKTYNFTDFELPKY